MGASSGSEVKICQYFSKVDLTEKDRGEQEVMQVTENFLSFFWLFCSSSERDFLSAASYALFKK